LFIICNTSLIRLVPSKEWRALLVGLIVDIPEGLPVPMVSSPPTSVLESNSADKDFLSMVFDFGSLLVHDNLKLRADIRGSAKAYHFSILKEWTGINRLPITNVRDASKRVNDSCVVICFILLDTCI
jgi:hypothetical protein